MLKRTLPREVLKGYKSNSNSSWISHSFSNGVHNFKTKSTSIFDGATIFVCSNIWRITQKLKTAHENGRNEYTQQKCARRARRNGDFPAFIRAEKSPKWKNLILRGSCFCQQDLFASLTGFFFFYLLDEDGRSTVRILLSTLSKRTKNIERDKTRSSFFGEKHELAT